MQERRSFDIDHSDPHPRARAAAVRARTERDPVTAADARGMTMAERMRAAFEASRFAARLRDGAR